MTITQSLNAIINCDPKNNLFLSVEGEGENQHLTLVRRCWLGRILMWLGFTSSCMAKIAKFVESRMPDLCKESLLTEQQDALDHLITRFRTYNKKHWGSIERQVATINKIYEFSFKETSKSISPLAQDNPVDIFKSVRGHVDQGRKTNAYASEVASAVTELQTVQKLLSDNLQDPKAFQELFLEMTPAEVESYVYCVLENSRTQSLRIDVFALNSGNMFFPVKHFSSVIQAMSLDQLKSCVNALANHYNIRMPLFNALDLIRKFRSDADQKIIFEGLVKIPFFRDLLKGIYLHEIANPKNEVITLVFRYYLFHLLRSPCLPSQAKERGQLLREAVDFMQTVLEKSPLQDQHVLDQLTENEIKELLPHIVKKPFDIPGMQQIRLLNNIMTSKLDLGVELIESLGRILYGPFLDYVRYTNTALEKKYVEYLVTSMHWAKKEHQDKVHRYLTETVADKTHGVLVDPKFVKSLFEYQIINLGYVFVSRFDPSKSLYIWKDIYFLNDVILSDPKLAVALYKSCKNHQILRFCNLISKNTVVLKEIEDSMDPQDLANWKLEKT